MSIRALCQGVVDRLKDALKDPAGTWIQYRPDGEPIPSMGQHFISVSFAGYRSQSQDVEADDRLYSVNIDVWWKMAYAPNDRRGPEVMPEGRAYLLDLCDQIPGYVLRDWDVINKANGYITGAGVTTPGYCETFNQVSVGAIGFRSPSWVTPDKSPTILAATIACSGARRIRPFGTVE